MPRIDGYDKIYLGRDNALSWTLFNDAGQPADITTLSRVTLYFKGTLIDSDDNPGMFDWSQGDGKLVVKLGAAPLQPGTYRMVEVTIFDPAYSGGLVWGHKKVRVRQRRD